VTDKPPVDGVERSWDRVWDAQHVYRFQPDSAVYAIDTPPPSVVGRVPKMTHVLTYTQVDALARYARMCGREPFFPVGWDNNDPSIEHRVCERLAAGYPRRPDGEATRRDRLRIAEQVTDDDSRAFEQLWRTLGISVDWSARYTTLGEPAQIVSQQVFLHGLEHGHVGRPSSFKAGHWELRTGWDDTTMQGSLRAAAAELRWLPTTMEARLIDVLRTRTHDLPISERRTFGIPVPLWYPIDQAGKPRFANPIVPARESLPLDPAVLTPPQFRLRNETCPAVSRLTRMCFPQR